MFQLSLVDHIRLSFGAVATSYRAHARAAERLSARAWQSRMVVMVLLGIALGGTLVALTGLRYSPLVAVALAGVALLGFTISIPRSISNPGRTRIARARPSSGSSARNTARSWRRSTTAWSTYRP